MTPETSGFLTLALPLRKNHYKRVCTSPSAVAAQDQWEQYESRNRERYAREREIAREAPTRDRHHQVFLTRASKSMFRSASERFMASIRYEFMKPNPGQMTDKRLWLVESIADDTFGTLRGAPDPPRVVVMESLDSAGNGNNVATGISASVSRWTAALNRVGKALSPIESYHVDYAVWGGASRLRSFHELHVGHLVACEMLNADWTDATSVEKMRNLLLRYAEEAVESGKVEMYQVLQSVDEPTVFKTVEVYSCMDGLRDHMTSLDPEFSEKAMQYRAAVNRVRQLYRCVETLHNDNRTQSF